MQLESQTASGLAQDFRRTGLAASAESCYSNQVASALDERQQDQVE
jgi:hypothetical protein